MFIQIMLHWFGDYILQSDYMALNKTKKGIEGEMACMIHCFLYALPFIFIIPHNYSLFYKMMIWEVIIFSHYFIDRFSLAKYLIWLKNHLNPTFRYYPWRDCNTTGYQDAAILDPLTNDTLPCSVRPYFITIWLYIITDNGLHIICNYLVLKYL